MIIKKRKLLIGLVSCLAIISICAPNLFAQQTKSGWDYLQNSNNVKDEYVQELNRGIKDVSKRIYKEGDLEAGVLKIKQGFNEFPDEETISITLRNADIKEVLRELARLGKKSIIIDNSVQGTISCELEDVSINQAMDLALATAELESRIIGDTIFVASKPAMLRKGLNRRVLKSIKLNYANALDVASLLEASIFNKGLEVKTQVSEETAAAEGSAQQATAQNYQVIEDGGTTFINDNQGNMISAPASDILSTLTPNTSASSTGSVGIARERQVRIVKEDIDPAVGFNDAKKLAGEIKINGVSESSGNYSINNNSGGTIVIPDTRNNTLLIAGLEEDIYLAEQTIKYLDMPKRQVSIEVSLIEMTKTDLADIGVVLGGDAKAFTGGFNSVPNTADGTLRPTPPAYIPNGLVKNSDTGTATAPSWAYSSNNPINLAKRIGLATTAGQSSLQLSTVKNLTSNVVARIEALLQKQKLKLIANPNVIVLDGSEALVKLTSQIINRFTVTSTTTSVTTSQQLADVGIVLNVLPRVSDDGYVTMRIRPSVTTPGDTRTFTVSGNIVEITLINTREAIIQEVRTKSGETIALAGLIREFSTSDERKVPFVGDLPFIGSFFKTRSGTKQKTELVILITPKIIEDIGTQARPVANAGPSVPID
ncbi:MAG: secretin N-terminal domain-containing protein [Cyanobacteriota bacterium]